MFPSPKGTYNLHNVTDSFQLLAKYIQMHNLQPKCVVGMTFEKLARASRRYGFSIAEVEIPENTYESIVRVIEIENPEAAGNMDKVLLCYQETEHFLERYLQE